MTTTTSKTTAGAEAPLEAIKSRVEDLVDQAKESGSSALDRVKDLVENHPFESLGAAFAVGYILKMLTGPLVTTALLGAGAYLAVRPGHVAPKARQKSAK